MPGKIYIISTLFIMSFRLGYPQPAMDKKIFRDKFQEAEYFFLRGNFRESAFLYHELLRADPANANLQFLTGASYLSIDGMKQLAIPFLEEAVASVSPGYREGSYRERNAPREAFFALGRAYHIANRFGEAIEYYEKYKNVMPLYDAASIDYVKKQIASVHLAMQMIKDSLRFSLFDPGDQINATARTFRAVLAQQDSVLIYMSQRKYYPAIMETRKMHGIWTRPVNITGQLMAGDDFEVTAISSDASELYLTRQDELDHNIYVSRFDQHWYPVEKLPPPVNSQWDETHASLSSDMQTMVFTSNRPGGSGAMDIWFSHRQANGSWSEPVNAGGLINSLYSEETPFLTGDGHTLYFSSMGHATMGGFDIFYTEKLPDGNWSVPANTGFPLNSTDDDLFFVPLDNEKTALYSNLRSPMPEGRLEWISFGNEKPDWQFTLQGRVSTEDYRDIGKNTVVEVVERSSGDTLAKITPDPETGNFTAGIKPGDYRITIRADHYHEKEVSLNVKPAIRQKNIRMETSLKPSAVSGGEYLLVRNILFGFDSSKLTDEARTELEKLCRVMEKYPDIYVQVRGHTDSKGPSRYNLTLSRKRARSAVDYLVSRGISRERFISSGVGEKENIAVNVNPDGSDNPEGRKFNRQVEIKLINNDHENIRISELLVPDDLRPLRDKRYHVVLKNDTTRQEDFPALVNGKKIKRYDTESGYLYTAGTFQMKHEAMAYLNEVIDGNYPDALMLEDHDFKRLLKTSDFNPGELDGPFTIQLLALQKDSGFSMFANPENIQLFESNDGYFRYVSGIYETYRGAKSRIESFVEKGFTDAFVMPLSRYTLLPRTDPEKQDPQYYFTIQITATRNKPDPRIYRILGETRMTLEEDGYYRISQGIFLNKSEAEEALIGIREKGFGDAFIRKIVKRKEGISKD